MLSTGPSKSPPRGESNEIDVAAWSTPRRGRGVVGRRLQRAGADTCLGLGNQTGPCGVCIGVATTGSDLTRATPRSADVARAEVEALYRDRAQRAGRLAYLLTGDAGRAEELLQEAFTRLLGRWRHIHDRGAVDAYLRRTVVNLARKSWRRSALERRYLRSAERPGEVAAEPDVATRAQLRAGLAELTFRQRAAIVLRYYEDLPERDIARILGCAPGTVKSSLSRGVAALKVTLEDGDE